MLRCTVMVVARNPTHHISCITKTKVHASKDRILESQKCQQSSSKKVLHKSVIMQTRPSVLLAARQKTFLRKFSIVARKKRYVTVHAGQRFWTDFSAMRQQAGDEQLPLGTSVNLRFGVYT